MSTDSNAFEGALAIPGITEAEAQYLTAVARGEGFYGRGWANPNPKTVAESAQFGLSGKEGADSKNWGAIQGTGTAGSFQHIDHHSDGSLYVAAYKKYASDTDAARDLAKVLLKPNVKLAIAKGNIREAVFAQHANHYFELDPESYLSAVKSNYAALASALNWTPLLIDPGKPLPLVSGSPSSVWEPQYSTTRPTLRLGNKNDWVGVWQRFLKIKCDNEFGPLTEIATKHFQTDHGLVSDGVVGRMSWSFVS